MKKQIFKVLSVALSLSTILNSAMPAFAYDTDEQGNSIEEFEYQNTDEEDFSNTTNVFAELGSVYNITIPKYIVLSGNTKAASYFVKVQGDIAGYEEIEVVPEEEFNLFSSGKNPVKALVNQDKTVWKVSDFDVNAIGSVAAPDITAGSWQGSFNFNIDFKENGIPKEKKLSLDTENIAMGIGDTTKVTAFYDGEDVSSDVVWKSDNKNIKVNDGIITTSALAKPGDTANITVSLEDNDILSAMLESVGIVMANADESNTVAQFKVTIVDIVFKNSSEETIEDIEILPGENASVTAHLVPELDGTVSWSYTAPAGISLKKERNKVTIFVADDMPANKSYNIIATYGDYSNIITLKIKGSHEHVAKVAVRENEVAATCANDGSYDEVVYCQTCGKEISRNYRTIDKLGHNYSEGKCTRCDDICKEITLTSSNREKIGWTSSTTTLNIPEYLIDDGITYKITSIGDSTFSGCTNLTSVTIPDSVTSIGYRAFGQCKKLASVDIPNSVTKISDQAFFRCSNLTSITIPDSITSIGDSTFFDCTNLTSVTIPDSVTSIGKYAFASCSSLVAIEIPSSVTSIGDRAFVGCTSLTSITIPDSVTSISDYAFANCSSLATIEIPDSVTSIGAVAFENCTSLTSITIPDSVTSINISAFDGCKNLVSINVNSANRNYCSADGVLFNKTKTTLVRCLVAMTGSYTIPDSVTSIGTNAFNGCNNLTSVTIPNSVTSIRTYAFQGCKSLTSITIPDSVTSISDYAFANCSSLATIEIPNSVTSIGDSTFFDCTNLTSVTIPDSVTSIGKYAFASCSSLVAIEIPSSVTSIGMSAFANCKSLKSVVIPDSVAKINNYAFKNCTNLTSVTFKNTSGWYATTSSTATSGTNVSVTNATTNAQNLVSTYVKYYWKRK